MPLTVAGRIVIIRQYRHGIGEVGLEIPGRVIDHRWGPAGCARREWREETGYEAGEFAAIGQVARSAPIQDSRCYSFIARGAYLAGLQVLDASRRISRWVEVGRKDIPRLVAKG